jgi:hypothetical protein
MATVKEKIKDNNELIRQRLKYVLDMMQGNRPADNNTAIRFLTEVRNMLDNNEDLLDRVR